MPVNKFTAPRNEQEQALEKRKNDLVAQTESDRRLLMSRPLFDLRSMYLAELDRHKLPYTELDTKDKFIDMIVFMAKRRLESVWFAATEARVTSREDLDRYMADLDRIESDWSKMLMREPS